MTLAPVVRASHGSDHRAEIKPRHTDTMNNARPDLGSLARALGSARQDNPHHWTATTPEGYALAVWGNDHADRVTVSPAAIPNRYEPHTLRRPPEAEPVGFTWSKATPPRVAARVARAMPEWIPAIDAARAGVSREEANEQARRIAWRQLVDFGARPSFHGSSLSIHGPDYGEGFSFRLDSTGGNAYIDRLTLPADKIPALAALLDLEPRPGPTYALSLSGRLYALTEPRPGHWEARDPGGIERLGPRWTGTGTREDAIAAVEALTH